MHVNIKKHTYMHKSHYILINSTSILKYAKCMYIIYIYIFNNTCICVILSELNLDVHLFPIIELVLRFNFNFLLVIKIFYSSKLSKNLRMHASSLNMTTISILAK